MNEWIHKYNKISYILPFGENNDKVKYDSEDQQWGRKLMEGGITGTLLPDNQGSRNGFT